MADKRPLKEKFPEYQKELQELNKKYDMLIFAIIERSATADTAVIKVIDDNDQKTKQQLGIIPPEPVKPSLLVN